jgi:hypothetical protein
MTENETTLGPNRQNSVEALAAGIVLILVGLLEGPGGVSLFA